MWIRVAREEKDVHYGYSLENTYVEGNSIREFYFNDDIAQELEQDGFLNEMWEKLNALFDWGDCDYFPPEKCRVFKAWLEQRLKKTASKQLKQVYENMLDLANLAIQCNTGISFDF